jgi:dTDP-4-dehydrorhamnose 3,5-epimerase
MSFDAKVTSSKILPEVKIFEPSVGRDSRGTIFTTYDKSVYDKYLPDNIVFNHDKFAESVHNVLRGLHGDTKTWKLITCVYGEIYQVVVDMRPESPTYLKWDAWTINTDNKLQVLVPPRFVNGYYVKSDHAVFHYKLAYEGEYFDVKDQQVVMWNDKRINIDWPCADPILHARDKK